MRSHLDVITVLLQHIVCTRLIIEIPLFPFTYYLSGEPRDAVNKNAEKYWDRQTSQTAILRFREDFHNIIERSSKGRRGFDLLSGQSATFLCVVCPTVMFYRVFLVSFHFFLFINVRRKFMHFFPGESYLVEREEKGYPFLQVKYYVGHG